MLCFCMLFYIVKHNANEPFSKQTSTKELSKINLGQPLKISKTPPRINFLVYALSLRVFRVYALVRRVFRVNALVRRVFRVYALGLRVFRVYALGLRVFRAYDSCTNVACLLRLEINARKSNSYHFAL